MNDFFVYSLFIIACFVCMGITFNFLNQYQHNLDQEYDTVDDMKQCPKLTEYIVKFQSNFKFFPIAIISFCAVLCFNIIFMGLLFHAMQLKNRVTVTLVSSIYVALMAGFTSYKVQGCVLARICYKYGCIKNYFAK